MREDVNVIMNHFKKLYSEANPKGKTISQIVKDRRNIVEKYGSINDIDPVVDPSVTITKIKVRGIPCEWICAPDSDPKKRLLYLHGGAFLAGSLNSHRGLAAELSKRSGVSVLAVDYRLAPEYPFPAGLDDCFDAYDWIIENGPDGKSNAKKLFVSGDSAGGNLSIALLLKIKQLGWRMPDAVLPISPVLDMSGKSPSITTLDGFDPIINKKAFMFGLPLVYLFGKDVLKFEISNFQKYSGLIKVLLKRGKGIKNPLVSPMFGDLRGLPPIFINVGDVELLRDDAIRFVDKARKQGVKATVKVWPDMIHVFVAFLGHVPEADECLNDMAKFIKRYS